MYIRLGQGGDAKVSPLEMSKTRALVWHPDKEAGKKPADVGTAAIEFCLH
ncbi:unnamed protein product [Calypogeia fissa]